MSLCKNIVGFSFCDTDCQVATVDMETMQLVLSQLKIFLT